MSRTDEVRVGWPAFMLLCVGGGAACVAWPTHLCPASSFIDACLPACLVVFCRDEPCCSGGCVCSPLRACERIIESTHVLTLGADTAIVAKGWRVLVDGQMHAVQPWWCGAGEMRRLPSVPFCACVCVMDGWM